jgi:hypothetical protein
MHNQLMRTICAAGQHDTRPWPPEILHEALSYCFCRESVYLILNGPDYQKPRLAWISDLEVERVCFTASSFNEGKLCLSRCD